MSLSLLLLLLESESELLLELELLLLSLLPELQGHNTGMFSYIPWQTDEASMLLSPCIIRIGTHGYSADMCSRYSRAM